MFRCSSRRLGDGGLRRTTGAGLLRTPLSSSSRRWFPPTVAGIRTSLNGGEAQFAQRQNVQGPPALRLRGCFDARSGSSPSRSSCKTSRFWQAALQHWRRKCRAGWGARSLRSPNSGERLRKQQCFGEETSSSSRRHLEGGRLSRLPRTLTSIPGTPPPVICELPATGSELGL